MVHEHLAVAAGAGADADGGHVDRVGDHAGDLVGHALEHDGEAAGGGQGLGVGHQLERGAVLAALHLEAAHGVDGLRGEAEVAHHRDLGVDERLDHRQPLAAALELHGLGAGPDELGGVVDRVDGVVW